MSAIPLASFALKNSPHIDGQSTRPLRVAVVGAGIGGLAVAAALLRHGIACEIFEQAQRIEEVGAGIQVSPNAARLLHRLGIENRLKQVAVRPGATEMRRWDDNRLLARTTLGNGCARRYGAPYYTFHRADLHQVLLELLPLDSIYLGQQCVEVTELDGEVLLRFANGRSWRGDVVIGADGIRSAVRASLVRDKPTFSGQMIYRGIIPAERIKHFADRINVRLWLGPNQHCVCYPIASGRLYSFGATIQHGEAIAESWTTPGRVEDLTVAYQGWNEDVQRLIGALDGVNLWALHDRDPIAHWSSQYVTLVGDAAHPMLPFMAQGANQAIEDAFALAKCMNDTTLSISDCLTRYQNVRAPRTAEVQRISRENSSTFHLSDGDARQNRDRAISVNQKLNNQEWLFGYDAELAVTT